VTIEGELVVRLECDQRKVRRVTVRSTRPHAASRVAIGRTPEQAVGIIPALFGICTHAQRAAAATALEAAKGTSPSAEIGAAREWAVALETIQEYLWRILIDGPSVQGHPPAIDVVAEARRLIAPELERLGRLARRVDGEPTGVALAADAVDVTSLVVSLRALAARHVYGSEPADWLELADADAVAAWAERRAVLPAQWLAELLAAARHLGRSDIALMPAGNRAALMAAVVPAMRSTADFAQAPTWAGVPMETGALARTRGHPIGASFLAAFGNAVPTRMAARLVDLAMLLASPSDPWTATNITPRTDASRIDGFPLEPGEGCAAVETARGLLLHRARVASDRVVEYQIVAPTEWNFHPAGALVRGLEGTTAESEATLARDARFVVQALDPCVACRVEVSGA
jgi:hypothetical protein